MTDESTPGSQAGAGSAGTQENTVANGGQAQSGAQDLEALRTAWESKAHAHGRKAREKELISEFGCSIEEARERLAAHRQSEEAAAAAAVAESEERQQLASKLIASEKRIKELEGTEQQLGVLRAGILEERIRASAAAAGVLPAAIDDYVYNASKVVGWNDDFTEVIVRKLDDPEQVHESFEQLAEELREKKPHLFPSEGRSGTGFFRAPQNAQSHGPPKLSSIRERASWGRD